MPFIKKMFSCPRGLVYFTEMGPNTSFTWLRKEEASPHLAPLRWACGHAEFPPWGGLAAPETPRGATFAETAAAFLKPGRVFSCAFKLGGRYAGTGDVPAEASTFLVAARVTGYRPLESKVDREELDALFASAEGRPVPLIIPLGVASYDAREERLLRKIGAEQVTGTGCFSNFQDPATEKYFRRVTFSLRYNRLAVSRNRVNRGSTRLLRNSATDRTWQAAFNPYGGDREPIQSGFCRLKLSQVHIEIGTICLVERGETGGEKTLLRVRLPQSKGREETQRNLALGTFPDLTDEGKLEKGGLPHSPVAQCVRRPGVYFEADGNGGRVALLLPDAGPTLRFAARRSDGPQRGVELTVSFAGRESRKHPVSLTDVAPGLIRALEKRFRSRCRLIRAQSDPAPAPGAVSRLVYALTHPDSAVFLYDWTAERVAKQTRFHGPAGRFSVFGRLSDTAVEWIFTKLVKELLSGDVSTDDPLDLQGRYVRLYHDSINSALLYALQRTFCGQTRIWEPSDPATRIREILSAAPGHFSGRLKKFQTDSLLRKSDHTNLLSDISTTRLITFCGPGQESPENIPPERRDVHPSHYGRICPSETPESDKVGLDLVLARRARVIGGDIYAPFYRAKKGVLDDSREIWLRPADEKGKKLTSLDLWETGCKILLAREDGDIKKTNRESVDYVDAGYGLCLGMGALMTLLPGHTDGTRTMMTAKNLRSALPLVPFEDREQNTARLFTGIESEIGGFYNPVVCDLKEPGDVVESEPGRILVRGKSGTNKEFRFPLPIASKSGTPWGHLPIVHKGDAVQPGAWLAAPPCMGKEADRSTGTLFLGVPLLTAWLCYEGFNMQDAIVVSSAAARKLTSLHWQSWDYLLEEGEQIVLSDFNGRPGWYNPADDLGHGSRVFSTTTRDRTYFCRFPGPCRIAYAEEIVRDNERYISVTFEEKRALELGDKLMGRSGNKGVVALIEENMPEVFDPAACLWRPVEIILNPLGVLGRRNLSQLYEAGLTKIRCFDNQPVPPVLEPFRRIHKDGFDRRAAIRTLGDRVAARHLQSTGAKRWWEGERKIVAGYTEIYKLNHLAGKKLHAVAKAPRTQATGQPRGGSARRGAQRVGELERMALEAHNARHVVRDVLFDRGGGLIAAKGDVPPLRPVAKTLQHILMAQGMELKFSGSGAVLRFIPEEFNPDDCAAISSDRELEVVDQIECVKCRHKTHILKCKSCGTEEIRVRVPFTILEGPGVEYDYSCPNTKCTRNKRAGRWQCGAAASGGKCDSYHFYTLQDQQTYVPGGLLDPGIFGEKYRDAEGKYDPAATIDSARMGRIEMPCPVINPLFRSYPGGFDRKLIPCLSLEEYSPESAEARSSCPSYVFLKRLYVLPPYLRPGREKGERTSDVSGYTRHYRTIFNLARRLEKYRQSSFSENARDQEFRMTYRALDRQLQELFNRLSSLVCGKKGLFRQNIVATRADYSGRAVIVSGPDLPPGSFGIPESMAGTLFKDEVEKISDPTARREKLRELLEGERLALNRAPSLTKHSILACRAHLNPPGVRAIRLDPLLCAPFAGDFDGDTMGVHRSRSAPAREQFARLMGFENNLFNSANGDLFADVDQDVALGLYLLSRNEQGRNRLAGLFKGVYNGELLTKKESLGIIMKFQRVHGDAELLTLLAGLKQASFAAIFDSALAFGINDVPDLPEISAGVKKHRDFLAAATKECREYLQTQDVEDNPLCLIIKSGARSDPETLAQMALGRGHMTTIAGKKYTEPVTEGYALGINAVSYFSCGPLQRLGMINKKMSTPKAGDLTRTLAQLAYDLEISDKDQECGGLRVSKEAGKGFSRRLLGRVLASETPSGGTVFQKGSVLGPEQLEQLDLDAGLLEVSIRSPFTCGQAGATIRKVCPSCYGWDLSKRKPAEPGLAVGILAAQSVGERGTQLSMKTFHTGAREIGGLVASLPQVINFWQNLEIPGERGFHEDIHSFCFKKKEWALADKRMSGRMYAIDDTAERNTIAREVWIAETRGIACHQACPVIFTGGPLNPYCPAKIERAMRFLRETYGENICDIHYEVLLSCLVWNFTEPCIKRKKIRPREAEWRGAIQSRPSGSFLARSASRAPLQVLVREAVAGGAHDPMTGRREGSLWLRPV